MWITLTCHLSTPREPILEENTELVTNNTTIPQLPPEKKRRLDNVSQHLAPYTIYPSDKNERDDTHCNPTKLNVKSAILVDSFRPLMEGVPAHLAACGILIIHGLSCTQVSALNLNPKTSVAGCGVASDLFES